MSFTVKDCKVQKGNDMWPSRGDRGLREALGSGSSQEHPLQAMGLVLLERPD